MSSGGDPVSVTIELGNAYRAGGNWKRVVVKYQIANATGSTFTANSITVGMATMAPVSGYMTTVPANGKIKVIYVPTALRQEEEVFSQTINLSFTVDVGGTEFPVDDEVEIIETDPCAYGGE